MASAGASRTVAAMALSVPSTAVVTESTPPTTTSHGAMRCSKLGKRKNSAYSCVNIVPSALPSPSPSTKPTATIASTSFR